MIFKKNKKEPFLRTLDVWIAWSFVTVVLLPFSLQNFHSTKKLNLLTNKPHKTLSRGVCCCECRAKFNDPSPQRKATTVERRLSITQNPPPCLMTTAMTTLLMHQRRRIRKMKIALKAISQVTLTNLTS